MLKISLLRNVRKINLKIDLKVDFKNNFKISFKVSRILILFWRISLKTRFFRVFYTFNQFIYDIHYIFFNKL